MAQGISHWEAFSAVPDPRERSGQRHPLQAILTLTSVAILSGCRSLYAIAQFGRDRGKEFATELVLDQIPVDVRTNEHKAALELLNLIPLKGKIVLGDAMFCQKERSRRIRQKGGDWIWPVKANQPELHAALKPAFEDVALSPS